jgi:TIR domain
MATEPTKAVKVFYCYAHKDKILRDKLESHLEPLRRSGQVVAWYDHELLPGTLWETEIDKHLNSSDIILLLISPSFLASDYCYRVEMGRALQRHEAGEARVIPIILRPVDWEKTPLKKIQALPTGGKPITNWSNRDNAFLDVARGIGKVIEEFPRKVDPQTVYIQATSNAPILTDSLSSQSSSYWTEEEDPWNIGSGSFFEGGAYHVKCLADNSYTANLSPTIDLSDFAFQVEMTILSGQEGGGPVFRAGGPPHPYGYRFFLGRYGFNLIYGSNNIAQSAPIKAKLNQTYLLTVVAIRDNLFVYRDKQCLASVKDSTARSGTIGLLAFYAHVMFRNAQAWDLTEGIPAMGIASS